MLNYNDTFREIANYRRIIDSAKKELDALEAEVKAYMTAEGLSELIGTEHKAAYKMVSRSSIDTTALKREMPDVAARFTKTSESARFNFS